MKILGFFLTILCLNICNLAFADTKQDIAKCATTSSDASRLICYDGIAEKLGVDKPLSTVSSGNGKWRVRTDKSPIDDSENVYLSLQSEESVSVSYHTIQPTLVIRCSENKTSVFLAWDVFLGTDSTEMLLRFDSDKAKVSTWSLSTDNKAVFVYGSDVDFAKKMMKHKKLLAQVTPYNESPVMATFAISGLSEAIKPLRKACHW